MRTGIVIGSYRGSPWLGQCLASIPLGHELIVVANGGFECAAIKWAWQHTDLDEFLYLQDSVEVMNREWVDRLFTEQSGSSVSCLSTPGIFGSFLGKYRREVLDLVGVPETHTKMDAIKAEREWTSKYAAADETTVVLWPELTDNDRREERFGRENMVLENAHIRKMKGSWSGHIIE